MYRRIFFTGLIISLFALSGCKTIWGKRADLESQIQKLESQISIIESRLKENEKELLNAQKAIQQLSSENKDLKRKLVGISEGAVKRKQGYKSPSTRQVQIALRGAGFNPGPIDGKLGVQTRNAIRAFQKANNLAVSGKVDEKTWEILKKFLYERQISK